MGDALAVESWMAALSERKLDIVRTLVETAPDRVVEGLNEALQNAGGDTALASVRAMVETEARDRQLRNVILLPIAPLCVGDGRRPDRLVFPAQIMGLLWRGMKSAAPAIVRNAELALYDYRPGDPNTEHFDRLVRGAAKGMRAGDRPEFRKAAELCDGARPGGAEALVTCLDVATVVRRVAAKLPEWMLQPSGDGAVGARLAYKDACAISPEAGVSFFQMVAAQLQHEWKVIRIISGVMDKPKDGFLASTDLGIFGERVLASIEQGLQSLSQLDPDAGPEAAVAAARTVDAITNQANELDTYLTLNREQGWGAAVVKHRQALAATVERRFRDAEKLFAQALPSGRAKRSRGRRTVPSLGTEPDPAAVRRCETLLTFVHEIRYSAGAGGFASSRSKLIESLGEELDHYVEELLDLVKTGEAENETAVRAYLGVAAEFSRLIRDDKAAELVRRRTAAAAAAAAAA